MTKGYNGKRLDVPAGAVYALLAAVSLICITILGVAIAGDNEPDKDIGMAPREDLSHLYIEDVYFKTHESATYTLMITVYITNDGTKDASNVKAHIWPVVEESNIAMDMEEMEFGDIRVNETKMADKVITLKAGTLHSVELLIFDSGKLVVKGRAEVSTDGQAGAQYSTVEVKGTAGDSDYDGLPDVWEEYYGLDPSDPSDARSDADHDGINNLDEYRLNRDPTLTPAEEEDPDTDTDNDILAGLNKEEAGSPAFIGAGLVLLLVAGVFIALIGGAVASRKKMERRKEFFIDSGDRNPPQRPTQPERRNPEQNFEVEAREGRNDEDDLPKGRGIYE